MITKYIKYKFFVAILIIGCGFMACSDRDDIIDPEYDRLFSPVDLELRIVNQTGVRLNWQKVNGAETYTVDIHSNGDLNFEGTAVRTITGITYDQVPYTVTGLDGDTDYSVRVQAVGENISNSKWTSATFKTDTEQILQKVSDEDLGATEVTLRWIAGETATNILITPGNIDYKVTANDIAAGTATITGLTGETSYTAVLMNGSKVRGTMDFVTLIDVGDATIITAEDDLVAILDAAAEGDSFVLMEGEYALGDYAVTKSVTLSGYKEKPVITGRFTFSTDVNSIELKKLTMSGGGTTINIFEASAACTVGKITLADCEFRDYARAIIYNNNSANFGDIAISNCIFTNFPGDGGDGIDFRGGTLNSFKVENSTFNSGFRAFVRLQVTTNVSFRNCTFYRISSFNNSNNSGLFRISGGTFEVRQCLFVETGVEGADFGNWCKQASNMGATATYEQNYYYNCFNLWAGLYTNPSECDASEANPGFKDPTNGDFTLSNEDLIFYKIGDSRWRP